MKEIKIEETIYKYKYEACDGTQFDDKEECIKYEKTMIGIIRGRLKEMCISEGSEEDFLFCGSCDNDAWVCVPKNEGDVNTLKQAILAYGGSQQQVDAMIKDDYINTPVVVITGYDSCGCWITSYKKLTELATDGKFTVTKVSDKDKKGKKESAE